MTSIGVLKVLFCAHIFSKQQLYYTAQFLQRAKSVHIRAVELLFIPVTGTTGALLCYLRWHAIVCKKITKISF